LTSPIEVGQAPAVGFSSTPARSLEPPERLEHNLIVDWLALGFTAAKIRQCRQLLDADGEG
jgi:hypothetical protein